MVKIDAFSIGGGEILEQFDFVSARRLHNGEFDFQPQTHQ